MTTVGGVQNVPEAAPVNLSPAPAERPPEQRELIQAVKALNAAEVFGDKNEVTFVLDRRTHRPIVRIVDRNTKQVVRQIPPDYAMEMAGDLKGDSASVDEEA
jgi:flagellar protein FlaG